MSITDNPWPFGKEHCVQCGDPCSIESHLCEDHAEELKRRSRAEMQESVSNGTFDKSGELAADIEAFHGSKPKTGFGDME